MLSDDFDLSIVSVFDLSIVSVDGTIMQTHAKASGSEKGDHMKASDAHDRGTDGCGWKADPPGGSHAEKTVIFDGEAVIIFG